MKTKIFNLSGAVLALVMVLSLLGAFLPVNPVAAQAPAGPGTTPNQWQGVSLPTADTWNRRAADVGDFAVAGDGKTIYACDTQTAGVLYSDTKGVRWTLLVPPAWTAPPRLIAVAPDNPQSIAVVDSSINAAPVADGTVWISNNGGTTWAQLNPVAGIATSIITGIAIGPSRSGTILGRDYAVSVADTAATVFGGDVWFQGLNTAWQSCAVAGAFPANTYDFTSVAMSPGFLGDRCLVAVGSDAAAGGTAEAAGSAAGDTHLFIIKTSDVAPVAQLVIPPNIVRLDTTTTDSPPNVGAATAGIVASDIALPADFDPTTVAGTRVWVSWTSTPLLGVILCGDDVYRADNTTVRKLQTGAGNGIWSIAYAGTIAGGVLIAGENAVTAVNTVLVWHTEDPNVAQPSWAATTKAPTGRTNCVVGIDAANPKLCYAGTTGVESAFSVSENGALSFNGRSLINTEIDLIHDVILSPDGVWVFAATSDNLAVVTTGSASDVESLWKSKTPTSGNSWERINISPNGIDWGNVIGGSIIRLSPEFGTDSTLYWIDRGAATVGGIQRSVDGGNVFRASTAPAAPADVAVENKDIVYMASAGNVNQSTNGAWFFGLPVATGAPVAINTLVMCPTYPEKPKAGNLLLGSAVAGGVVLSTNSGASWRPLTAFIAGGLAMQVLADVDYATNNTVYAASATAGQGIWRYVINQSTVWEQILAAGAPSSDFLANGVMTGLAMQAGYLYGSWTSAGAAAVGAVAADSFRITAAAADAVSTVTVAVGSVLATSTSAGVTLGGIAAPFSVTLGPGAAVAMGFPVAGGNILFTALTANSAGTWACGVVTTTAAIVTDTDADAGVFAGGAVGAGIWSLPDIAVAGVAAGAVGAGCERSLIPDVPVIANWMFETMNVGAAAANFNSPPSALRIAGTATATSLWTINTVTPALFAYDDTMAKAKPEVTVPEQVPFDSVSGRNQQFTIAWKLMSNAIGYEVEIYSDAGCSQLIWSRPDPRLPKYSLVAPPYTPPNPLSPTVVVSAGTLVGGTEYFLRIRARNQIPNDLIRSNYSSVYRFVVQGGERVEVSYLGVETLGPQPGATGVPQSPGFTWSPFAKSTRYEFQLGKDPAFATVVASAKVSTTAYKYDGKLDYGTTYFWRARGIEPTISDWSPVASFTVEKAPPPPPAPAPAPPPAPPPAVTPTIIWSIIGIGFILVIAVIVLIVRTRARA